ncbi:MAG: hypothetical protein ACE5LC_00815 [Candidatus Aminicenantales bacterium]
MNPGRGNRSLRVFNAVASPFGSGLRSEDGDPTAPGILGGGAFSELKPFIIADFEMLHQVVDC